MLLLSSEHLWRFIRVGSDLIVTSRLFLSFRQYRKYSLLPVPLCCDSFVNFVYLVNVVIVKVIS